MSERGCWEKGKADVLAVKDILKILDPEFNDSQLANLKKSFPLRLLSRNFIG